MCVREKPRRERETNESERERARARDQQACVRACVRAFICACARACVRALQEAGVRGMDPIDADGRPLSVPAVIEAGGR